MAIIIPKRTVPYLFPHSSAAANNTAALLPYTADKCSYQELKKMNGRLMLQGQYGKEGGMSVYFGVLVVIQLRPVFRRK